MYDFRGRSNADGYIYSGQGQIETVNNLDDLSEESEAISRGSVLSVPLEESVTEVVQHKVVKKRITNGGKVLSGTSVKQVTPSFVANVPEQFHRFNNENEMKQIIRLEKDM